MSTNHSQAIQVIERDTGLQVDAYKAFDSHSGTTVLEVNHAWVFRFAGDQPWPEKTQKQLDFLTWFADRSPIAIPRPAYVTDEFVGYQRIAGDPFTPGDPFHPTEIDRLGGEDKRRIAKQMGTFLAALHQSENRDVGFDTGYLSLRQGYYRSTQEDFRTYLREDERRRLNAKLSAIADDPANFIEPRQVIHGDLWFGNILWDRNRGAITGIIDWHEMGLGIPAMDFIALADFTTDRNDQFLRDILRWYDADDSLFSQVKQNAVIEVLNWFWFYERKEDSNGVARTINRLKGVLSA